METNTKRATEGEPQHAKPQAAPIRGGPLGVSVDSVTRTKSATLYRAIASSDVVKQNMFGPLSKAMKVRLPKPLYPQPFQPTAPPQWRRGYREILREFDHTPPKRRQTALNTLNEIHDLFDDIRAEGIDTKQGHRFIIWQTIQNLARNNTP